MLSISGLRKSYGDFVALHGLDLEIGGGEILALLGPNGAGKSTTVKCLVGLLRPDTGQVQVDGRDALRDPEARRLIGTKRISPRELPSTSRTARRRAPASHRARRPRTASMPMAHICPN